MGTTVLDFLLDRSVVFSFDRSGFARHRAAFRADDLAVDLRGRVAVVTGANSGIGRATAEGLARLGADVWLACRREPAGRVAADGIRQRVPGAALHVARLDVSDLDDIRRFAREWDRPRIDILVNNAGVLPDVETRTAAGLELTLATNLVGPFLLTQLLRPRFTTAPDPRVVLVSSGGMYTQKLDVASLASPPRPFDGVAAYARTKRAQVVLNQLWAGRDASITYACMHPGWADTPAVQTSLPRFRRLTQRILRTPEEGADTVVWLAACRRLRGESGRFWFDRSPQPAYPLPWTRETPEAREALWRALHQWAGLPIPSTTPPPDSRSRD